MSNKHENRLKYLVLLLMVFGISKHAIEAKCKVESDYDNVASSILEGIWVIDVETTTKLWPELNVDDPERFTTSFTNDHTVLDSIPDEDCDPIAALSQIFMAGMVEGALPGLFNNTDSSIPKEETNAYALLSYPGNPMVVWWRERDGDPYGDTESFNIMVAKASHTRNDMLFVGGDFNNQPFYALKRYET